MFDVLTIAAVADEITETLIDGRIQRVGLVDPLTVAAEVYAGGRRHSLVASADGNRARIHLAPTLPSLDPALITPFGLLLRKYLRGGVIVGVDQPPLERLIRLSIAKRLPPHNERRRRRRAEDDESLAPEPAVDAADDEDALEDEIDDDGIVDATYVHLAVEIMGRHSNLILIDDDGRVMESAKRVTTAMSRVRPVLPRLPYTPPPPIDKPEPRRLTAASTEMLLAAEPPTASVAKLLVDRLRGISPQMAREIAFRVGADRTLTVGDLPPDGAASIARETRNLLEPLLTAAWAPRVYRDPESDEVAAFAPLPMGHLAASLTETPVATISEAAMQAVGSGGETAPVRHAQRRSRLLASVAHARERQERRLVSIRAQATKAAEAERWREWGETIFAYLWQIEPGQRSLVVEGRAEPIPLDPARPAKETAQDYFERYRNAQSAGVHAPQLEDDVLAEIGYLDQLRVMIEQAHGFAELEALAAEWEAHGGDPATERKRQPQRRAADKRPRPLLDAEGNAVYIGRSGAQNDQVTFDIAGPNDTWLHARGSPGSHVIVRWHHPSGEERDETIEAAAALAAYYSTAREATWVEVDVTRRRHVRKIKGTGPGMVTYRNERTIAVRPADESGVASVVTSASDHSR